MGLPDWDQHQRDKALQKKLIGKIEKHHDFATDKTRFRYIDPKDGRYYDEEVEGRTDDFAIQMAMQLLAKQVEAQRKMEAEVERARLDQDAIEGRDTKRSEREYCMEQARYYESKGDKALAEVWQRRAWQIEAKDPRRMEYPKYEDGKYFTAPPAKATLHKDAHFPTKWLIEAIDRAEQSTKAITFTFEREGVVVVAMEAGEKYAVKVSDWTAMETAEENPLLKAIEDCEKKLDILHSLKDKVRGH
jgi:hypothetical protein